MKKIFSLLFLLLTAQCVWSQKDTIPRFGSNQGQTYTSAGVTYVYYNYSTQPSPVTFTPNASQTSVRINNVTGDLSISLTNTSSRLGDQIILCFNSDSIVHNISGSGIDFSRYFPAGIFQCKYFCGIFFFVVDETGQRIFVNNDSPRISASENSSACNYSAGFGAMNANNSSTQNTNVGINAGHNILSSGLSNTNLGCSAGTGITGGDFNVYIGALAGSSGNFSNVVAIGFSQSATANGQTIIGAVSGNVYFGGVGGAGSFPNITLQGANRTGTNVTGNSFSINAGGGTGGGTPGPLQFRTYDTSGVSSTTPQVATVKMTILGESGNVGIGTTSPTARLHLNNGAFKYNNGSEGLGRVLFDSTGAGDVTYAPTLTVGTTGLIHLGDTTDVDNDLILNADLTVSNKIINTTASDTATINSIAGRFRKDITGTTFTLTDSFCTPNSIIMITLASDPGNSNTHNLDVVAGSGSFVVTFENAPNNNTDINFLIVN